MYKSITTCRICSKSVSRQLLDLGKQPLANGLLDTSDQKFDVYPLALMICEWCWSGQLSVSVAPELLFPSNYPFRSGIAVEWQNHCKNLANIIYSNLPLARRILEIGYNDGCMLKALHKKGLNVVGVDPTGIELEEIFTVIDTWKKELAIMLMSSHGSFDVIIAQNVLAHVQDPHGFMEAVSLVSQQKTQLIIEVPYFLDLLLNGHFDTIYHEHLSYFSLLGISRLLNMHGFGIRDVEYISTHGGSIRVWASKEVFKDTLWLDDFRIKEAIPGFVSAVNGLKVDRPSADFFGYGASAKATVAINYFDLQIEAIYDDAQSKAGKFIPANTPVPILSGNVNASGIESPLMIFSWNNLKAIKQKLINVEWNGKIVWREGFEYKSEDL